MQSYRLGIDIGGTFTDFSLLDEATGRLHALKTPSVPAKPATAVFEGIGRLIADLGLQPDQIRYFIHGTTLAVNTVIERKGAKAAVLVTKGFRDILNIGRHRIPDVFNFFTELPVSLVPRARVVEIPERCGADGRIVQAVDEAAVREAVARLAASGVDAFGVCFLHSYKNPRNERLAGRAIAEAAPGAYVSLSSELWPQLREYERALVAVMNAYVGRKMAVYFDDLESGLRRLGLRAPVLTTKSNGGVMSAREAGERPVETLLSGPAAGVIGASFVARSAGFDRVITLDMGGTSADVAIVDGEARYSTENQVGDFPVIMPAIDVTSIGAGGGSIAWTDADGVLKVGPHSAGASPGPACYGFGGSEPTVTDAYVCLGIVDPGRFLGGSLALDPKLAGDAIHRLGRTLGLGEAETAESILRVATSQMYATLVPLLARKGVNLDEFALFTFGGAGPTHGFLLAREVGIRRVLVPRHPGVLCATGSLVADVRRDFVRTMHFALTRAKAPDHLETMRSAFLALSEAGRQWLDAQKMEFERRQVTWTTDVRYVGQSFELTLPVDEALLADATGERLTRAFHAHYARVYGYSDEAAQLEILDIRTTAVGVTRKPALSPVEAAGPARAPRAGRRKVFCDGRPTSALVLEREALPAGYRFDGPAIVEQYDSTVFVPPGFRVVVDGFGNLVGEAAHGNR
jgi:N-methylhydantoinase A